MENNRVKEDRPEKKEFAYTFVLILAEDGIFKIPSTKDYHDKKSPQNKLVLTAIEDRPTIVLQWN